MIASSIDLSVAPGFHHRRHDRSVCTGSPAASLPWPLRLILLSLFLPIELSFFVGDLRLTVVRALFLLFTPYVLAQAMRKVATGSYRFVASDLFVPLTSLWMFIGPSATYGVLDALHHSGPIVLEYLIAYLSTRVLLPRPGQTVTFATWTCALVGVVALVALLDPLSGQQFTHVTLGRFTGLSPITTNEDTVRYGFVRASGTIDHPILFGFVEAIGLVMAAGIRPRWRPFCVPLAILGLLISISSAPQLCALLGLVLYGYGWLARKVRGRWVWLATGPVAMTCVLFAATSTPFAHVFQLTTIDPATAYYRLYIWNSVGPAILEQPWFSVVPETYDYQGTIDSVWLVMALTYGMPGSVLAGLSMIGCCSLRTSDRSAHLSELERRLGTALGIIMFLVIFMGFTVHFWGSTWVLVGLLIGLRARLGELGRLGR